jgi:long-chain acyl-CoA synthetase
MGIASGDTQVAAIPLSHAYGFGNLLMPVFLHGTAIVLRDSFVPHQLSSDAHRFGARVFHGVPYMFRYFLANEPHGGWPVCLRLLISAGAPLDAETIRAFHRRFGLKIHSFYGTTEAGGITFDSSDAIDCDPTVGWAIPGVTVGLRPDEGLPTGHGRIHVLSSAVGGGYAGEFGGDGFVDGGFLTGDYGRFAADGRLVLGGRVSAFINVAGRKVHPAEVETALRSLDGVADVRVLAADDRTRGEQIVAVIVRAGALTAADVRRRCAGILAPYKIPRTVLFVDEIPMTTRGKTDRHALEALVGHHLHGTDETPVL